MKLITPILIMLSCALSLELSAQETFSWAHEVGKYTMYKHDFFNDDVQKLFSIPDSLFTHDNMTGSTNFVNSFEFTKDRSKVYFLETQGDLYLYTIDVDNLEFIVDLTLEISPIWHAFNKTLGLRFINDSTLYIYGQTYGTFNINTREFTLIRQVTSFFDSITPEEKEIASISACKFKNRFLYIPDYPHLDELFLNNPDSNELLKLL